MIARRLTGWCLILAAVFAAPTPRVQAADADNTKAKELTFDSIKFKMDDPKSRLFKREMLTESIEKLDGKPIRIRGFILPTPTKTLTGFVLVRDNMECCFGPGAALYDCIIVEMEAGSTAEYTIRPVAVEGSFTIKEWVGPDGKHLSIYHLRAKEVK